MPKHPFHFQWCYAGVCIANGNAPIRPGKLNITRQSVIVNVICICNSHRALKLICKHFKRTFVLLHKFLDLIYSHF